MTERLPCRTEGCTSTILPSTAEKTGGFCMPCVNRAKAEDRARFIAANRVDVDRFAGVRDIVEILGLLHHPPPPDPLKNYLPFGKTKAELYRTLTQADADRLVDAAAASMDDRFLRAVASDLACFADVEMSPCQRALLDRGDPYPPHTFRAAARPIVDQLFSLLERIVDVEPGAVLGHTLGALAWTRDPQAVDALIAWSERRRWNGLLFLRAGDYANAAGYEIAGGTVRDLTLPDAFELVAQAGAGHRAEDVSLFERDAHGQRCPRCARPAVILLRFDVAVPLALRPLPAVVPTCVACACFVTTFVQLGHDGWNWLPTEAPPVAPHETGWDPPPPPRRASLSPRRPWEAIDWCEADGISQVGGHPSWIDDPMYPPCPRCALSMSFIAQVAMEDFVDHAEGIFYVHHCAPCAVVGVSYQQT